MTIKEIKPPTRVYRVDCRSCKKLLEFEGSDIIRGNGSVVYECERGCCKDYDPDTIICPYCKVKINIQNVKSIWVDNPS